MGAAVTAQQAYRFREDDGSITGATWLGAGNNTNISRGTGTANKFRWRAVVEETNGGNANVPWILYASYNSGTYFQVTTSTSYIRFVASSYVSDGTAISTPELGWSGTYDPDEFDSDGSKNNNGLLSEYGEPEYCLYLVDADLSNGDTIDLRVYESAGAPCDSYAYTGRVTVDKGGSTINLSATLTGASTTPDTAALQVLRAMASVLAGASITPTDAALSVLRAMAAVMAGTSTTPDDAVLDAGAGEVTQTGSAVVVESTGYNSSQGISVPSDAELAILCITGWTDGGVTFGDTPASLNSVDFTKVQSTDDQSANGQVWIGYLLNPTTGTPTFAWDLNIGRDPDEGVTYVLTFWKGVNTGAPIADSDKETASDTDITGLSAGSGDMMVGVVYDYGVSPTVTDNSQTEQRSSVYNSAGIGVGSKLGATGFYYTSGAGYQTCVAIIIAAGGGGGGTVSLSATLTGTSTTPADAALSVLRDFSAVLTGTSTTPTGAVLSVLRGFSAILAGASVTPDDAELLVSAIVSLSAILAGSSTTPDDAALAVNRALSAILAGSSNAPDDAILAVVRDFAATISGTSTTPNDAILAVLRSLSATLAGSSLTPDDAELLVAVLVALSATLTGTSTTPDDAALAVVRSMAATLAGSSSTPDDAAMSLLLSMSAILTGSSTTPDDVELLVAGFVALSAILTGSSSTPDDAEMAVLRSMSATLLGSSSTPDDAAMSVLRAMVATLTGTSTTPDDAVLSLEAIVALMATMAGYSETPDDAALAVIRGMQAVMAGTSTTPESAALSVLRALQASAAGSSSTPDDATMGLLLQLAAILAGASTTPDDASLTIPGVVNRLIRMGLTGNRAMVGMGGRPGANLTGGGRPDIDLEES